MYHFKKEKLFLSCALQKPLGLDEARQKNLLIVPVIYVFYLLCQ
jgi:hypothetical protein